MGKLSKLVAAVAGPRSENEYASIDVRKIDNGYVTRQSRHSDDGGYESKETFSPDRPSLEAEVAPPPDAGQAAGAGLMARAKRVLSR